MTTRAEQLEHLARLMKKIDIAMLTTAGAGGYLVSRPLSTQAASFEGESVWFFSEAASPKVAEIRRRPKVNVAYSSKDANTYISASGDARIVQDRALVHQFWNDALKAFFPNGPDDPNVILIQVHLRTIEYWDGPGSWFGKAVTYAVALATGNDDVMGENRIVDVATGRSRKPAGSDRPGRGARKTAKRAPAAKKSTAKKRAAKSGASKKAATSKAAAKKTTAKKQATRTAAKKTTTKRTPARKR